VLFMDRERLLRELDNALVILSTQGGKIEKNEECPSSAFVVRTPCYAAFFSVVDTSENLAKIYANAEKEISKLISMKSNKLPRDLELVLLVADDQPPEPSLVHSIIDNQYICRKFVLWPNGRHIHEVLADLPFWPPDDLLSRRQLSIIEGVKEALRGYDTRLITDLASYSPGAERVFEKIRKDSYSLLPEPSTGEPIQSPPLTPTTFTQLKALDIRDFRGIRSLRPEDMPLSGDVIFIYGPNGVGKTSIVDAMEWAITGQVDRLQRTSSRTVMSSPDPLINVFSDNDETRVICHLSNDKIVSRIKRGRSVERQIGFQGAANDRDVIDYVVGTKASSRSARLQIVRLRDLFRSSHMLSQHNIRQFLEGTEAVDRFDILTNMIGAEEFVRFRDKTAKVLMHLRSDVGTLSATTESLGRELEDVSKRLQERHEELDRLTHAVTNGKSPEDLASELIEGLKRCQCSIDEAVIKRINFGPEDLRSELIAVHADTVIREKRKEIDDLLVQLKIVEQELQGYVESNTRCESLSAEIANTKAISATVRTDLSNQEEERTKIKESLQVLSAKQAAAARRYISLTWLKENLPVYTRSRETLRHTEDFLVGKRGELQRSEAALEEQQKLLVSNRARLQELEQRIATKTNREQSLVNLQKQLPQVLTKRLESEKLGEREKQLDSRLGELKRQATSAQDEANTARARLDALQKAYISEAARHDVLGSFLAKLAELVNSAECPLCGRHFASVEEAKHSIQKHVSSLLLPLRELSHRLDETKKDADSKHVRVDSIAAEIRTLAAELEQARSSKAAAKKMVQAFLDECAALAITVPADDETSWRNALEQASKESEVSSLHSEASGLRSAIEALAPKIEHQQITVQGLRKELIEREKERSQLVATVQGLEADMVAQGLDPVSPPKDDQLTAELLAAQYEARGCDELVATKKAELGTVESAIAGLIESLRKADVDIASKENQLRQYETVCNRFIAMCRSIAVDPENPKGSIHLIKQKALAQNQSLASMEEKRQALQQIASLGRLKDEIVDLERVKSDVSQRTEKTSCEYARLCDWISHIGGLEAKVIERQMGVVDTHLERLGPTMQRLYHRLHPHPIFGEIRIRVNNKTCELDVEAEASVASERLGDITVLPSAYFSEAQMNSLAITVFLAGALRQQWSGFSTILIDDPVQQMDEMNVHAFLDLLRGLSGQRQFIIFTCSRDFYLLALDKLVCLNNLKRESFLAYRLEGIAPAALKVHRDAP